jgi:hypothetical protein
MCTVRPGLGEKCNTSCSDGAYCDFASNTCKATLDAGASCVAGECKSNLVCVAGSTPGSKICSAPGGAGASCSANSDCASGIICDTTLTPSRCAPQKQAGQACRASSQCAERLLCTLSTGTGTCVAPVARGGSCVGNECQSPHKCIGGTCVAPANLGDPCPNQICLTGYCNPASATCEPLIALGQPCDPALKSVTTCQGNALCDSTTRTCHLCQ